MTKLALILLLSSTALIAGACTGDENNSPTQTRETTGATTTAEDETAALEGAVREALRENDRLSGHVLRTNRVPTWATRSTRGPALTALRKSAAERRERGIRLRTLSSNLEIISVDLDPSFASASALVRSRQRVRPYRAGRPVGRAVRLDERARVELRRLGESEQFVVWRLEAMP
jgi:hypothetical protein